MIWHLSGIPSSGHAVGGIVWVGGFCVVVSSRYDWGEQGGDGSGPRGNADGQDQGERTQNPLSSTSRILGIFTHQIAVPAQINDLELHEIEEQSYPSPVWCARWFRMWSETRAGAARCRPTIARLRSVDNLRYIA